MSTGIEEQLLDVQSGNPMVEYSKKPMRTYTREFLLSLSELEVCKKLPDGFDESLLSEFDDASHGFQDRQRATGTSSLQGFRRSDYGSSGPGRGDSGSFSRGLPRWDSRSSGRSDTDSDSESGRRYDNQTGKSGQNPEHDGLLGSGSFPRPAGYAAGAYVPRFRPSGNFLLNRSNEPYHPPRPYKTAPHSRREANDSYNDETFGATDSTSEDRVEEEKQRRAEFELMRKEQQKVLQDKQKSNPGKLDDPFSDITGVLGPGVSSDAEKLLKQAPQDDRVPALSSAPPSRPLVPPGFVNSVVDKSSTSKSLVHGDQVEVGKTELQETFEDMKIMLKERGSSELQDETTMPCAFKSGNLQNLPTVLRAADQVKASSFPDVTGMLEDGDIIGLDSEIPEHKLPGESGHSTSILEKLFGNAITSRSGGTSNLLEDHDAKAEGIRSPNSLQSKFASWFLEEDKNHNLVGSYSIHASKKPFEDLSCGNPNALLSLIVGGEKGGSDASDATPTRKILQPEMMVGHLTSKSASSTAEISDKFSISNAPDSKPAVLTCEDLEQSILSEIGGNSSTSQPAGRESHALDVKTGHPDTAIDNLASQHLLSLLQGGTEPTNMSFLGKEFSDKPCDQEVGKIDTSDDNISSGDVVGLNNSGKTLTLEALFGTAFMKELHSAQGNSAGSARTDVPEPNLASDSVLFPSMNEIGSGIRSNDASNLASDGGVSKLQKGHWSAFHDPVKEAEFLKPQAQVDSNFRRLGGVIDVRLPEEDSLFSLGDPINGQSSIMMPDSGSVSKELFSSSSSVPATVMEKLATLGGALRDERSMVGGQDPMLMRGPYDVKSDLPYQGLHPQATSSQLHAPQMNHGKPLFHPLDSHPAHLDSHLKFMPPEAIIHHDAPMHHQFPTNMGHPHLTHHSGGLPGFDHPVPPILQQMHMAGNLPPPHLMRGFHSGAPMPPHPNHNSAGYIQEHNSMQGFPFAQRQLNFGGAGMTPAGSEIGGANNPSEAFQRLLELERRANPKPMLPFSGAGHTQPMYGHELDMGFRYG